MSDKRDEATEIASTFFDPGDVLHAGLQSMIQHALMEARSGAIETTNAEYREHIAERDALQKRLDDVIEHHYDVEGWCAGCNSAHPCVTVRLARGEE